MSELWYKTLTQQMRENAERFPDNDCVVAPECGVRYSWRSFDEATSRVARGMMALGIGKGDHVAIWAYNLPEWILTQFATAKIGAVLVTVNTNYKRFELEYLLRQSDTKMLVMMSAAKDNDYIRHISELAPGLQNETPGELDCPTLKRLKHVLLIGDAENRPQGMRRFDDLYALAERVPQSELEKSIALTEPHDVINMQYTSGTTGFPKGVMLTHYNILNNGQFMGDRMHFTERDRLLIVVPLFHCFGCVLGVMSCITHATSMVLMSRYHPVREMDILESERCTAVHGVPTMFIGMLAHPDFDKHDFSHLRTGIMAGSPCPISAMREVTGRMHIPELVITYGQTECSPGMTMSSFDDPLELRVSTVGKLLPHTEGKIIDPETGRDQPFNVPGEIVTRGYHIMKGYYHMPEATRAAVDENGWLHTGDIGTMDEAGNFRITGRLKDMIIRGGENIYPRELEEFIYTHPAIQDVQVVGVPDARYGEEVLAFCILKEGAAVSEQALIDFVRDGLSRFKAPRYVIFVDTFPMTASGKIQKFKLREMGVSMLHLEAADSIETA